VTEAAKIVIEQLGVRYAQTEIIRDLDLSIPRNHVLSLIGPAGSGKTTLLRTLTLLSVDVDGAEVRGRVLLDDRDVLRGEVERASLRRRVALVSATPQPLLGSVYYNLTFGPRLAGAKGRAQLDALVEVSLRRAELWDEVKDRLHHSALALSGGQQQRMCIARALALEPEVVLLDEPCSGLDPISTSKIERMMRSLSSRFTWVIVTNNTKQAARVSDRVAFLLDGRLIESGPTHRLFTAPGDPRTGDYLEGRFG
jgi:phosphate transport system ATP-binding protein